MICLPPSLALLRQAVFSECRCLVFTFQNTSRSEWFTCSCHLKQTSFICNYVLLLANKILKQEKNNVSVGMKPLRYLYFTLQNVKLKLPCTVCLFHSAGVLLGWWVGGMLWIFRFCCWCCRSYQFLEPETLFQFFIEQKCINIYGVFLANPLISKYGKSRIHHSFVSHHHFCMTKKVCVSTVTNFHTGFVSFLSLKTCLRDPLKQLKRKMSLGEMV